MAWIKWFFGSLAMKSLENLRFLGLGSFSVWLPKKILLFRCFRYSDVRDSDPHCATFCSPHIESSLQLVLSVKRPISNLILYEQHFLLAKKWNKYTVGARISNIWNTLVYQTIRESNSFGPFKILNALGIRDPKIVLYLHSPKSNVCGMVLFYKGLLLPVT